MNAKLPLVALGLLLAGGVVYITKTSHTYSPAPALMGEEKKTPPTWTEPPITPPKKEEEKKVEPPAKTEFFTFQEGIAAAKKADKHAFVVFHADWCGWCKKLEKDTLSTAEVKDRLKNLVIVHVDADKEPTVVQNMGVTGLPAYFIVSPDGKTVKTGSGYKNVADFKAWCNMPAIRED